MQVIPIKVNAKVWLWNGKGSWHFVTIEKEDAEILVEQYIWPRRGFGAIPVNVTVGKSKWKTSIFPEKSGSYLLPLKRSVRDVEGIKVGEKIAISLKVLN